MASFDPSKAIAAVESARQTYDGDETAKQTYIEEIKKRLQPPDLEDRREASRMAVGTSQLLITISTAVLVGIGTLAQIARSDGIEFQSLTMGLFALSAILLATSMFFGFNAISMIYKRGEGREDPIGSFFWSTGAVKGNLDAQSILGMLALVALGTAFAFWVHDSGEPSTSVTITMPGGGSSSEYKGPLEITGDWNKLSLRTALGQTLTLPKVDQPVSVDCR